MCWEIEANSRKQLDVDENYRTSIPHVYAVGDVVGRPGLASASYDQGRFAATHIVRGVCQKKLISSIPAGIYTSPEISCVGPTEREHQICNALAPALRAEGLFFVGIDVIGGMLSEINVTSPTGVREVERLMQQPMADQTIEQLHNAF